MTHVPASSHGGFSTPAEATVSPTGGLILNQGTSANDAAIEVNDALGNAAFAVTPSGVVTIFSDGARQEATLNMSDNTAANPGVVTLDTYTGLLMNIEASGQTLVKLTPRAGHTGKLLVANNTAGVEVTGIPVGGGIATAVIASGALPTVAPVSATAFQCSTTRDVFLTVPVTYNPGVATTATCKVELSPDNVTFSTLLTITQPVGTVFDGSVEPVQLAVPAAWFVKLTVANATLGTGTYY